MITEQEFRTTADDTLEHARRMLLPLADKEDFEVELQNGVMQVIFEDPRPAKFVISPNAPVRQIWVSAMSRSSKPPWSDADKTFALDGEPLTTLLDRLVRQYLTG